MAIARKGKILKGQQYDPEAEFLTQFTEQMQDDVSADAVVAAATARTEVTPIDAQNSLVRTYTPPASAINNFSVSFSGTEDIALPNVLTSLEVIWESSAGSGDHTETAEGTSTVSLSLGLNARAEGSASIMPEVVHNIKETWAQNLPVTHYLFYMAYPVTKAQILAKLTSLAGSPVLQMPVFRPEAVNIVLTGRQLSLSVEANIQQQASDTTFIYSKGRGVSKRVGMTVRTLRLPPTIHGAFNLGASTQNTSFNVDAGVGWPTGTNWPPLAQTESAAGIIQANVTPVSIPATTPSAIPTSGLYVVRGSAELYKWGYVRVHSVVFNFSDLQ